MAEKEKTEDLVTKLPCKISSTSPSGDLGPPSGPPGQPGSPVRSGATSMVNNGSSSSTGPIGIGITSLKKVESSPSSISESLSLSLNSQPSSAENPSSVPQPPKKTSQDYVFGKLLGEGSFSSVYLAREVSTSKEFAIKVCDKHHIIREKKAEQIKREKEVLAILSNRAPKSPFFVKLYATFQDSERLYFVMTFGAGGELLKYLNKVGSFDIECSRFYSGEIIQGLRHLHKLGIIHRDIKPENILLDEFGHILITDFGSAKVLTSKSLEDSISSSSSDNKVVVTSDENKNNTPTRTRTRNNSFVGTAQYVSPEVLTGKYSEVGPACDLWAVGCIIYQFISGLPPFHGPSEYLIFQKILKLEYEFPQGFDEKAKTLVEKLLKIEPNERIGSLDINLYTSIQNHEFFADIDFDSLCDQTPPKITPYLPSVDPNEEPLRSQIYSQNYIPADFEPGFHPRIMAERVLNEDIWSQREHENGNNDGESTTSTNTTETETESEDLNTLAKDILNVELFNDGSGSGESKIDGKLNKKNKKSPLKNQIMRSLTKSYLPINPDERSKSLKDQEMNNSAWHKVVKGNLILKQGLVNKRKGLFSRKRMLLLTEGPHLYYCDSSMNVKGEIPWSTFLKPEPKDFRIFFVHTPNRTYYLDDPEGYALEWCKAINEVKSKYYDNTTETSSSSSR